ncbi:PRC-barrel domain-containing protein [Thermosyntropha lipolytica DSM 11003]|uniref:PRC-barrel domain-containing protein n=1 Tax=Thermosyntropha lipolytica DSM 11003 TaxID=1123382 RepID=A0A1M5MUD0_9FIRM|nr:PRC-barrel domain-containing protein [Thermosyntropha lipolytica]SHG80805.1 PRC-barrel domain-containing protein [Thermosyntropha lipolytica DSM 11003]
MKKSQEIIGLPVFSIIDGAKIGQVKDLVINPDEGKVDFIMVANSSWYEGARVLPFKNVVGIGEHAVTTESQAMLLGIDASEEAKRLLERNIQIKGTRVLTNKGNLIGVISEFEIDTETGVLSRLEYKTAQDEMKTEIIEAEDVLTYGTEVVVVREKGSSYVKKDVPRAETEGEVKETPMSEGALFFRERQKAFLLGKKVIQDIKDSQGEVLIPAGTVVNEEIIALAEAHNKFVELSQCVK